MQISKQISGIIFIIFILSYPLFGQKAIINQNFFETWHEEVKPFSKDELSKKSQIEKDIYEIFTLNYQHFQIFSFKKQFVVIQDNVSYRILDIDSLSSDYFFRIGLTHYKQASKCLLEDFRPQIQIINNKNEKIKTLYLTDKYRKYLGKYLGKPIQDNEKLNKNYNSRKIKNINKYINVMNICLMSSVKFYHLISYPIIDEIIFNINKTNALIRFHTCQDDYTIKFIKNNTKWFVTDDVLHLTVD
ncbi:MAG: hypothetical protein K8R54_02280 [Bacteroidales bacterium]|nr:hypothetical protein [Bacteroidales bacterium]